MSSMEVTEIIYAIGIVAFLLLYSIAKLVSVFKRSGDEKNSSWEG